MVEIINKYHEPSLTGHNSEQDVREFVSFIRPYILKQLRNKIINNKKSERTDS